MGLSGLAFHPLMWLCKDWDGDSGTGQGQPRGQDVEGCPKHPPRQCHWEGMGMHGSAFSTVSANLSPSRDYI